MSKPASPLANPVSTRTFVVLLLLLVTLAHFPLWESGFVQDDHLAYELNPVVQRGHAGEILSTSYWEGAQGQDRSLYRPVVIGSFAFELHGLGGGARMAQIFNVLLHLFVCFVLFRLMLQLTAARTSAMLASLLFAVHPIHLEAIGNLVGRAEILVALFGGLALSFLHSAQDQTEAGPARLRAWSAGLLFLVALLSKEIAVAWLPVFLTTLAWRQPAARTPFREQLLRFLGLALPFVAASLIYWAMRTNALGAIWVSQPVLPFDNLLVALDGIPRMATAFALLSRYAQLLVAPWPLSSDYSGPVISAYDTLLALRPILGILLVAAGGVTLTALWSRRLRTLRALGPNGSLSPGQQRWGLFLTLLVTPFLINGNLLFDVGAALAERFLYLPSLGLCALAGEGIGYLHARLGRRFASGDSPKSSPLPRHTYVFIAVMAAVVLIFTLLSWKRSHDWTSDEALFSSVIRHYPKSPRAHFVLGKLAHERGEIQTALTHLDAAIELHPDFFSAWQERGSIMGEQRRLDEAERCFREVLRLNPSSFRAHQNLAIVQRQTRRNGQAERSLRKALAWKPTSPTAWAEFGNLALDTRRYDLAIRAYERAIRLGRSDLQPRLQLAQERLRRSSP